ncbi:hypothetical protein LSTR_LSTR015112, partial [Laodelphax striatellus]
MAKKKKSFDDPRMSSGHSSAPDSQFDANDSFNKQLYIQNCKDESMSHVQEGSLNIDSSNNVEGEEIIMMADNLFLTGADNEVIINNVEYQEEVPSSQSQAHKELMPDDIQQIVLGDLESVTVGRHENVAHDEQHSWHANSEEESIICDAMEVDSESHIEDDDPSSRQDANQAKSFDGVHSCDDSMSEGEESFSDQRRSKRGSDAQRTAEYLQVESGIITISRESDYESSDESNSEPDMVAQCADSISAVLGFSDRTIFSVNIAKDNSDDDASVVDGDIKPNVEECTVITEEINDVEKGKGDSTPVNSMNDADGCDEVSSTVKIYSYSDNFKVEQDELDYEPDSDKFEPESDKFEPELEPDCLKVESNPISYENEGLLFKDEPKPDVLYDDSKSGVLKNEQKLDSLEDESKPDSLEGVEVFEKPTTHLQKLDSFEDEPKPDSLGGGEHFDKPTSLSQDVSSSDMVCEVELKQEKIEVSKPKTVAVSKTKSSTQKSSPGEATKKPRARKQSLEGKKKGGRTQDKEQSINESKVISSSQSTGSDDKKSKELPSKPEGENASFDAKAVIEEEKSSEFRSRSGSTDTTGSESGSSSSCRRSSRIKKPLVGIKPAVVSATDDSMPSPSRSTSSLMNQPSPVSTFSSTAMPEQGFDADKPVKVKSRWRRTSELEMGTRHLSSSS